VDVRDPAPGRRPVRSFVRREGRITPAQREALERLLPRYRLPGGPVDLAAAFGREAPVHMEIGFGMGDQLLALAEAHPEIDFIGVEVYRPGIGRLLARAEQAGLTNLRVADEDVVELLQRLPGAALAAVYVLFPDPWPKKRHHKRRLIQRPFTDRLRDALVPGGELFLATDWEDYAHWMREHLDATPGLENRHPETGFAPRPPWRIRTKFERRGLARGHGVWDLAYRRLPMGE